jgi:hypothetical protein
MVIEGPRVSIPWPFVFPAQTVTIPSGEDEEAGQHAEGGEWPGV